MPLAVTGEPRCCTSHLLRDGFRYLAVHTLKVADGSETIGLIRYLYGPGTDEEHIDPHLVAAFDPLTPDPGRDPKATYEQLQRLLDQPVNALPANRRPEKHVWHLSVRAAPEDPILSDEDWAAIARRTVAATGIAPDGDEQACRWAAVRHADDHIHIIATLVRDDGRRPRLHNEARRAQAECRRIEVDYDLRRVPPGDGTAAKRPTSAERHKAKREGKDRTSREELRETVRHAVAGATSEAEFFDRLTAAGVLIRKRVTPSGDLLEAEASLLRCRGGQSAEAACDVQAVVGAGPVACEGLRAGLADDRAQHQGDGDGVVGVAEHRDEVGDQVDGQGEVAGQQPQQPAGAAR